MVTERGNESGTCVCLPLTHRVNPDKASPLRACLHGGADQQVWLWELDLGMAKGWRVHVSHLPVPSLPT